MKPVFFSLILLCLSLSAYAQNSNSTEDVVVLKNGDRLNGEIVDYVQGQKLTLKTSDGTEVTILDEGIDQILQQTPENETEETLLDSAPVILIEPQTKGIYNVTQLSFAMGSGDEDGLALGAGLSTIFGKQFSPLFGLGLGVGLDNYARRGETIYPVFIDVRSYLPIGKKPFSYYATLNGGYGFAFKRESIGIREASGGILVHGAVGYRTTTKEGVDVNIDLGAKFQEASFSRDLFNGDIEVRELVFKRITIRVGITLWSKKN
ncbi:MAG: hypothetical protein AAFZ15_04420 [Bacteroidota bacterium]